MTQSFRRIVGGRRVVAAGVQPPGFWRRVGIQRLSWISFSDHHLILELRLRHLMVITVPGVVMHTVKLMLTRGELMMLLLLMLMLLRLHLHPPVSACLMVSPSTPAPVSLPGKFSGQEFGA